VIDVSNTGLYFDTGQPACDGHESLEEPEVPRESQGLPETHLSELETGGNGHRESIHRQCNRSTQDYP
jgi:hypothetical protein